MIAISATAAIMIRILYHTFSALPVFVSIPSTFTSALKRGSLKGTYSVSPEDKTVTLRYTVGNKKLTVSTLTAHVVLSGNELTLLFNADKLLKFLSTVSSISSNTTLKAINKLASEYDGMMLGFDLKK